MSAAELVLAAVGGLVAGGLLVWLATSNREAWVVQRDGEGNITGISKVAGRGATHAL